ncbi:MAG: carbohydrate ABC transporter permease [Caldilineaceae bacterium]|nr:carbohydrate ABC transporter permease [Caldilineaceae bacterium]
MAVQATPTDQTTQVPVARRSSGISVGRILADVLKYAVLLVLSFSFILPLIWMFVSAIKTDSQVYTIPPIWLPSPALWENFWNAWTTYNFNLFAYNTLVRLAIPTTIGVTISSAFVAYGFSRIRWKGRDQLFFICLATMMVPYAVTMVPLFIIFRNLGWVNTFLPLVVPAFFGSPYFIFMLRQFFMTIPVDLSEAARIDGANELQIMWRIILPLTKSALIVVALFQFMNAWNDYLGPLIYLRRTEQFVLALGLANLRATIAGTGAAPLAYPYLMAVSTIVTAPILIAFFLAQRTFIEGISLTGIKG